MSEDGAAQALGWPKVRVSARVKILELPEPAQQMIGAGVIALSAVDQLRAIGKVSPGLLDAVIAFLADGNEWAAERLAREPGWVLDSALRDGNVKAFAAYMNQASAHEISELRLGKKTEELYVEAEKLHKQITPHSYGGPPIRFTDEDVDQARAAGVLIEFERGAAIIVDRPLYRELVKSAVKRTVEQLRAQAAELAKQRKQDRKRTGGAPVDPVAEAHRERDRQLRELADQAHGVNLDLGDSLMNNLSTVDPASMDVARFLVYSLLGPDYASGYGQAGERIHHLAVAGIRLVIGELRQDVTKTRTDGTRGRLRIDYGDARQPDAALKWLWRYVDVGKTAGELFCRSEARTDRSESRRESSVGAGSLWSGSVRTEWDRREPCSRRSPRRCRSRAVPRSACGRPGISAIGASATAPTSSSPRRIPTCGICGTAAGGRSGRPRSTRATSPSSSIGALAGSSG